MTSIDPQQELFIRLLLDIKALGYDVYDGYKPSANTPYPFVYLADAQQIDDANKTAVFGNVFQAIDIYHNNPQERGTVSAMLLDIKRVCRRISHTTNFAWDLRNVNQRILPDNTTSTPLMHGILELEFKFS